jgi:hypothetical protein
VARYLPQGSNEKEIFWLEERCLEILEMVWGSKRKIVRGQEWQTERERDREGERDTQTGREGGRETHTQRERETERSYLPTSTFGARMS